MRANSERTIREQKSITIGMKGEDKKGYMRSQKIPLTRVFIVRRLEDLLGLMVRSSYSARKGKREKEKRIRKNPIAHQTLDTPRER